MDGLQPIFISTGQHRQMLDQACATFSIKPEIDLNIMRPGQKLEEVASILIHRLSEAFRETKPDAVLVPGDTSSAFFGALAGFYQQIPVGHVEAGLRTYDLLAPWPEEMNRRLIAPIARWCFAPTDQAARNLRSERIDGDKVFVTGNTVIDALLWTREKVRHSPGTYVDKLRQCGLDYQFAGEFLGEDKDKSAVNRRTVLVTGHRRESFGEKFEEICLAIRTLVENRPDIAVVYPVHLNPNVQEPVRRILGGNPRIQLIEPLDYETFIWLMNKSFFVLTDSGGVQEEAPSLGKPVLVMRDTTERIEGVEAGTCRLVGTDREKILSEAGLLLEDAGEYSRRASIVNPYGDGSASARIASILAESLEEPSLSRRLGS
jgi:UDP-N-acetylglucosamine 2-epimerase (non-hydrolysing)